MKLIFQVRIKDIGLISLPFSLKAKKLLKKNTKHHNLSSFVSLCNDFTALIMWWFCWGHLFSTEHHEFSTAPQSRRNYPYRFVLNEDLVPLGYGVRLCGLNPADPQVHAVRSHTHRRETFKASSHITHLCPQIGLYHSHLWHWHCAKPISKAISQHSRKNTATYPEVVHMKLNVAFFKLNRFWKYLLEGGHLVIGTSRLPSAENKQPKMDMVGSLGTCSEMVNGKQYSKSKHTLDRK